MGFLSTPNEHYLRQDVQKEIADFCRGRWVAVHCADSLGNLVFRRYIKGAPIRIEGPEDLSKLSRLMIFRSVYATANIYRRIERVEDVLDQKNISFCTPTWDLDGDLTNWRCTIRAAREIVRFLREWGIKESIYVKWSGNGCHIHINERSISNSLLEKHNPLDLAYAIVEYVNTKILLKIAESSPDGGVRVENKMDPTRVFTCPLSLHRELDIVCVCMRPEELEKFNPEWVYLQSFRHDPGWREYKEGEADRLAEAAYKAIGGYPLKLKRKARKTKPLDKQIMEWLRRG